MKEGLVQVTTSDVLPSCDHPSFEARVWAARIIECWRGSVQSIIRAGQLLIEAKRDLPFGEFGAMCERDLPFTQRVAQMLMAIAEDQRLANAKFISLLPPSYGTLYDLTRLSDDDLESAVLEKKIYPEMTRQEAKHLAPPRIAQPMSDEEILGSDGGVESRRVHTLQETRSMEGYSAVPETSPPGTSAGVAPGPSEAVMPSGGLAIAHQRIEPKDSLDFFPTPLWATRALFEHVLRHLERLGHCKFQEAWEPACGEGHMAHVLREYFRNVYATDIKDYGRNSVVDFLECGKLQPHADWIITNPPFNDSAEFVLKALKLAGTGVAMFVRLTWLESLGRYEKIFKPHPPTCVAIFSERVPLHKGRWEDEGTTMTAYIWLVWIKGASPQAPFWIPPGCREALTKPDDVKRFGKSAMGEAA